MDVVIAVIFFIFSMFFCVANGYSMAIALFLGVIAFSVVGCRRGYSLTQILHFCYYGIKDTAIIAKILCLISLVSAIWRLSGTMAYFVISGVTLITPSMFVLVVFLVCAFLSYILGSSFGVACTAGVVFMTLARSGGVNEFVTAGAIMSGICFGDRGSPLSSSAILVATITHTQLYKNLKNMMRSIIFPFGITIMVYFFISVCNPILNIDQTMLDMLSEEFTISFWSITPAIPILVLPFFNVKITTPMISSIVTGILVSFFFGKINIKTIINTLMFGFQTQNKILENMLNGGGIVSIIELLAIIFFSSALSGVSSGIDILSLAQNKLQALVSRMGRFWSMCIVGYAVIIFCCNQTIATITVYNLFKNIYEQQGASREEFALDIENSVIVLTATIPWALACSVPLNFLKVDYRAIPFSFLLYFIPFTYGITKKYFFKNKKI